MVQVREFPDPSLPIHGQAASRQGRRWMVRYRGFVLMPQPDLSWLVRPERSPMGVLPFRTPPNSLDDVKALVDWRLNQAA
ncbi:hypothetical protein KQ302_03525 [Synechococcus sp. CS-602]|uniref:hypothetical protein n=1 Tax=Synechococcaceae TaxID=1890426 RepID=UPI0008FF0ABA|nr:MULTISPECIES: hypothetical protein [Synechococcaceae]MCT4365980.1 hypothetical protein [Candidatus Regnicoccus frigidus MAG-AL1]APD47702.1 hypothetical protein BM449_04745 [Synechococcus sp. SynAce01]MCT0201443.1 hypothetical protein [Synechococcus sp. CS-603]MCT0204189.1 hypothetical protein [Synechococcus sp. CS-602]MCT0247316.1 hypothetical protein [Synechococcus sp. CS-601]